MDRHNENDDMHMKDTQNTEAQEEACAGAEAGDAGDAVQTLPENLESLCHEHVCPNCTEKRDADDARLRAAAEMDNFKKRLKREHEEQIRYAAEKVMSDLLPTLDNLDLALQYGSKDEACKDMLQGVAMTRKLLLEAVARQYAAEQLPQLGVVLGNENLEHGDPSVSVFSVYHRRPDFGTENFRFMN